MFGVLKEAGEMDCSNYDCGDIAEVLEWNMELVDKIQRADAEAEKLRAYHAYEAAGDQ